MKKLFFLFVALFMLYFTANVYSNDCPSGYASTVVQIEVNDCIYNVHICYNCTPSPSMNMSVLVFGVTEDDYTCDQEWSMDQVWDAIYDYVYTFDFFYNLCSSIPPCDEHEGVTVNYVFQKCWRKYNNNGYMEFWPCNDNLDCYCFYSVTYCWDGDEWVVLFQTLPTTSCPIEENDCDVPESQVPDPRPGYDSDCFYLWTPCTW